MATEQSYRPNQALEPTADRRENFTFDDFNSEIRSTARFDSHAPDAHPFGLPVHLAPLPAGSVRQRSLSLFSLDARKQRREDPVRKIIVPMLIVCVFVTVGGMTVLEEYFYRTGPRPPDATTERVFPQDVKCFRGVARVHLTRGEKLPFDVNWYWSPVLVGAGIVTAWVLVLQKRRRLTNR